MSDKDDVLSLFSEDEIADIETSDEDLMNAADEIPEDELDDDVVWVDSEDDETDEDDEEDSDEDEEEADDGEEADGEEEPEPEAEEAAKDETPQEPAPDLGEIEEQIKALKAKRKDILANYEDGDLTEEQMEAQLDALDDERGELAAQKAIAQKAVDDAQTAFKSEVGAYFNEYPALKSDPDMLNALDAMFSTVNSQKAHANKSVTQRLQIAHKMLIANAGDDMDVPAIKSAEKPKAKAKTKPKAKAKDPMREVPPTIAKVPNAAPGTDNGFDALDTIMQSGDPEAIENALANLSPAARDAYFAAG